MNLTSSGFAAITLIVCLNACERSPQSNLAPQAPLAIAPLSGTDKLVADACNALHRLPASRRGECCGGISAVDLSALCATTLAAALQRGSVRVEPGRVTQCANDSAALLAGCDWVGALPTVPPRSCGEMVSGSLAVGAGCESSLECADGFYCLGLGPNRPGVCAPPAKVGGACDVPADNLAGLLNGKDDRRHRSCAGTCLRGQCVAQVSAGGACAATALCESGLHCVAGTCSSAALAPAGATCSASLPCADALVCNNGRCAAALAGGAACKLPFECRSLACVKAAGETHGICADACESSSRSQFQ